MLAEKLHRLIKSNKIKLVQMYTKIHLVFNLMFSSDKDSLIALLPRELEMAATYQADHQRVSDN